MAVGHDQTRRSLEENLNDGAGPASQIHPLADDESGIPRISTGAPERLVGSRTGGGKATFHWRSGAGMREREEL